MGPTYVSGINVGGEVQSSRLDFRTALFVVISHQVILYLCSARSYHNAFSLLIQY